MAVGNLRILAQSRGTTSLASIYSPAAGFRAVIKTIVVANTSGGASDYQICLDDDGTTYSEATALVWNVAAGDATTTVYEFDIPMPNSDGNLAVLSEVNQAHTFTVIGEEFTV